MSSDLSPPEDTAAKLDKLTGTTGALIDAFDEIIKLPFVEELRIDDLGDKSVADIVLDLKGKYQALQGNTLPFARDLFGYAGVQIQTIPLIEESLPLETYLNLNKIIIARHKLEATQVKNESAAFRKNFSSALDVFENTIDQLGDQIKDLEIQIQETKDIQEKERAVAAIAGCLTFVLTTAAVFAVIASAGAVSAGAAGSASTGSSVSAYLASIFGSSTSAASTTAASAGGLKAFILGLGAKVGAASGTSGLIAVAAGTTTAAFGALAETIVSSIEARNFARAVSSLQSMKTSAVRAREELLQVVELMESVENSLDDIVSVWTDVEASLTTIQSDVENWKEENFSQELASPTIDEWEEVRTAVEKYTSVVSGERALKLSSTLKRTAESDTGLSYDRFLTVSRSLVKSELKLSLQAPELEYDGKLSDLNVLKAAFRMARSISYRGETLKSQVESAEDYLHETYGGLERSSRELAVCGKHHLAWLDAFEDEGVSGRKDMFIQLTSITGKLEDGLARAQETEVSAFALQKSAGILNNTVIRITNEKEAERQILINRLKAVEEDRKKRKWLWVVPVAGAINEIVDLANNIKGKIKRIRREINSLSRCQAQLKQASGMISSSLKDSTVIVQTYSVMLNDTRTAADSAVLFENLGVDIPQDLFIPIKQSWVDLNADIDEFLS